jgi:RNA polymerase sigma factor (sigma-70 family)
VNAHASRESDDEWAARVTRAVRAGSREALAEIYDRCAEDVVASIARITRRDESFALDCLQEMFMRLASNPPVCDTHGSLIAWMQLTALNVARNTLVAETRRARREQSREHIARTQWHDRDELSSILTRLDTEELELLRLRHIQGMRLRAIAELLGATPRAIESALRRIVARLREGGAR